MRSCGTAGNRHAAHPVFELRKARERGHILEGLAIALANIDAIIAAHQGVALAGGSEGRP